MPRWANNGDYLVMTRRARSTRPDPPRRIDDTIESIREEMLAFFAASGRTGSVLFEEDCTASVSLIGIKAFDMHRRVHILSGMCPGLDRGYMNTVVNDDFVMVQVAGHTLHIYASD